MRPHHLPSCANTERKEYIALLKYKCCGSRGVGVVWWYNGLSGEKLFRGSTPVLCYAYNGCLHQRSVCLRTPKCREYIDSFEEICGYSLTTCNVKSPSDCVHTLWRIRAFFPYDTCVCYEALGFPEECNQFRELIWNHPCERRMRDAGEERRAHEQVTSAEMPSLYTNVSLKRTTRTPLSDQIRQLKTELSFELGTREVLRKATCDSALNDVCLRHVSCRQLWKLFRSSCGVDQENRCTMSDRETCWQSFEGLSWTGLGNCHCDSANSDCHWIRLHTNYNKCIHDISQSGEFPAISSGRTGIAAPGTAHHAHRTQIKFVDRMSTNRGGPTAAPATPLLTTTSTTTSTTSTTTTTTSTTTRAPRARFSGIRVTTPLPQAPWTRGQLQGVLRVTAASPSWQVTQSGLHHSNQQRHIAQQTQNQADVHYRPLFEKQRLDESGSQIGEQRQVVTDQRHAPNSRWSLRQTPQQVSRQEVGPTQATLQGFVQAEYSAIMILILQLPL
ncbi:GDNF/GAS1 domain protein [Ancylostoma ceylanicum]|uniref:GDNF/GAS1 domain protein n=1 Tax=Ancylostoma ceylanicum TaxID=53326 RepID=A0A0D6MBW3_9BILA|nr:GDNF/GAS1 domain protein [Ancylostoma ceylanicum]